MIAGLFALIVIFGIVSAIAFLRFQSPKTLDKEAVSASEFDISEYNEQP